MNSVTKTCRLCDETKPIAEFYARKGASDGLRSECKACVKARTAKNWSENRDDRLASHREWYADNAEVWNARRRASRATMTDAERRAELKRNQDWVCRNREYVAAYRKSYYRANREKRNASSREYHAANREAILTSRRQRWSNDPTVRERTAAWHSANRETLNASARRYYIANRDKVHAYQAAYRVANRDVIRRLSRLRYLRHSTSGFKAPAPELRAAKWDYWGNACWMCGGEATTVDHVKPLSKGGSHLLANLRPACKPCNSSKHARWFGASKLSLFMRA